MKNFALLALVCGLLIGTLHSITRETISENRLAHATKKLRSVLNESQENIRALDDNLYLVESNGIPTGFIFAQTTTEGYNGIIKLWIAVDTNRTIRGVRVFQHQETPGIGDKIELSVSDWIRVFDGKSLEKNNWTLTRMGGDFDHFSGATITSRALVRSVKSGLESAAEDIDTWLSLVKIEKEQNTE